LINPCRLFETFLHPERIQQDIGLKVLRSSCKVRDIFVHW